MDKSIQIVQAMPEDAVKILKLIKKCHDIHNPDLPEIIDRFAIPWITDVVCFGLCFNACLNGRLVGSIGFSTQKTPWNKYQEHLQSQWFHVMDNYIDKARLALILSAKEEALNQEQEMQVSIPNYLNNESDDAARTINRSYLFRPHNV